MEIWPSVVSRDQVCDTQYNTYDTQYYTYEITSVDEDLVGAGVIHGFTKSNDYTIHFTGLLLWLYPV